MQNKGISVERIFEFSKEGFYNMVPELCNGRHSQVDYEDLHQLNQELLREQYHGLKAQGVDILSLKDEAYPKILKNNLKGDEPAVLFCNGPLSLLNKRSITIVGSGKIGDKPITLTKQLARWFTKHGYNVVSGYAKGADTSAHVGALKSGGTTTIVLTKGISNLSIKEEIRIEGYKANSLFLSHPPPHVGWTRHNAIERNKIICGLSEAVIIISSGLERNHRNKMDRDFNIGVKAIEMGIPLYVLRPEAMNIPSEGNNHLIQRGGRPFNGPEVLDNIKNNGSGKANGNPTQLDFFIE
jgi:DNA processing protein